MTRMSGLIESVLIAIIYYCLLLAGAVVAIFLFLCVAMTAGRLLEMAIRLLFSHSWGI